MNTSDQYIIKDLVLGKRTEYKRSYSPDLLQAIPRSLNRDKLRLTDSTLPFSGYDLWNLYEISYLNSKHKPQVAVGYFTVPHSSPFIVESKSLKLYLNSINFTCFDSIDDVASTIKQDLSSLLHADIKVELFGLLEQQNIKMFDIHHPNGTCIDGIDISVSDFDYNPNLLIDSTSGTSITEELYSNLMKSNCLVTGQPDWGTIYIKYTGNKIAHENLLKYIVSYRNHNEFHEMCVERVFCDLMKFCKPQKLTVYARYTRRGGIDINPFRSNFEENAPFDRLIRQ